MAPPNEQQLNAVIEKLVKDVELAVHAMYRGDVRQNTARVRTEGHRRAAYDALRPLLAGAAATPAGPARSTGASLSEEEAAAITRCIMAWLPMGPPSQAPPDSRCIAASRELIPTWGERDRAHQALKRLHG